MFTVILLCETEDYSLRSYEFLFRNFQLDDQIAIYKLKNDTDQNEIFEQLNFFTERCGEWKLLICNTKPLENLPTGGLETFQGFEALTNVIKYLSQKGENDDKFVESQMKGFFPSAIWYIDCIRKKYFCNEEILEELATVDEAREYGSIYRRFWFEFDNSSESQKQYELFRLSCTLLTLAINHLANTFLECGYLYHVNININKASLSKYVSCMETHISQIQLQLDKAKDILQKELMYFVEYPEIKWNKNVLPSLQQVDKNKKTYIAITEADLKDQILLESKLRANREWVRSRLHFPKGVLYGQMTKLQECVNQVNKANGLLSEAAKDRLKREKREIIREIQNLKSDVLDSDMFEKKLSKKEYMLRQKSEIITRKIDQYVIWIIVSVTSFIPLCIIWNTCRISERLAALNKNPADFTLSKSGYAWCFLGWLLIIMFFQYLMKRRELQNAKKEYEMLLYNGIIVAQKRKQEYMEKMLEQIRMLRYCQRLEQDDRERYMALEAERELLVRHQNILDSGLAVCRQMKRLPGVKAEKQVNIITPQINFSVQPKEIEYYWTPYRESRFPIELNGNGCAIHVCFEFINAFSIKKTHCRRKFERQNAEVQHDMDTVKS